MRKYWSQVAMLLLGVSLTVGFYEGRKLVKNTAKALTAATSISGSASGGRRHASEDEDRTDGAPGDELGLAANDEDRGDRRHGRAVRDRLTPVVRGGGPELRADRVNQIRQRQRQRLIGRPGGPTGPVVSAPPVQEPEDAQVDTGHEQVAAPVVPVAP